MASNQPVLRGAHRVVALVLAAAGCSLPTVPADGCAFGQGCGKDVTPPVVIWQTPAEFGSVSGNVFLQVTATDNDSILGVEFLEEGYTPIGTQPFITKPPYATTWDASHIPLGDTIPILAIALDRNGNADSALRHVVIN